MRIATLLYILLAAGCATKKPVEPTEPGLYEIDSVLARSEQSIKEACVVNEQVDSTVKESVVQINNHIDEINQQVQKLRVSQKIETVRVDTVYIETKKNFWGREKTKTSVVSNTVTTVDSTENK